jgi:8-oxo-dGTP pyrophosphatase MutT (NUDIX family)
LVYRDKIQGIHRVVAEFDGFTKEYFVSDRGDRAALLVVHGGAVLLARQYRLIVDRVALEIPGGKVEDGETPDVAAVRECLEETGVQAFRPRRLVCYHPSLDIMRNYTHIYYAEDCRDTGQAAPDRRTWVPQQRCLEMIFSQQITDVLTIVAVLAYQTLKGGR